MRRKREEKTVEMVAETETEKREDTEEMIKTGKIETGMEEMIEIGIEMIESDTEMIERGIEMTEEGLLGEVQEMTGTIIETEEEGVLQEMVTKVTEEKMIVGSQHLERIK